METRFSIYKGCFGKEISNIEEVLVHTDLSLYEDAVTYLSRYCRSNNCNLKDYCIKQEQKEYTGWVAISKHIFL